MKTEATKEVDVLDKMDATKVISDLTQSHSGARQIQSVLRRSFPTNYEN